MRFGVREICNVTFKALDAMTIGKKTFVAGEPVFSIETATTSSMEQSTSVVYANGGQGYNRLISWEGEEAPLASSASSYKVFVSLKKPLNCGNLLKAIYTKLV